MRIGVLVTGALLAMLFVSPINAQQPGTASDPHHPAASATAPAAPEIAPAPASKDGGMPMMDVCRQMMGDGMGMPMMGTAAAADPKEKAQTLQMRGEMMKAMGDVMMKHARRMQETTAK
jgi:hypothetical protein